MGDMYDIALGDGKQQERGAQLLGSCLGFEQGDIPRFRDAWHEIDTDGTLQIALYTRVGGNNRQDYMEQIEKLEAHPLYLRTDNDEFDTTYATFRFIFPTTMPKHLELPPGFIQKVWDTFVEIMRESAQPLVDTDRRWQDAIEALDKTGPTPEQIEKFTPVAEKLKQALENPPDDGNPPIIYI